MQPDPDALTKLLRGRLYHVNDERHGIAVQCAGSRSRESPSSPPWTLEDDTG